MTEPLLDRRSSLETSAAGAASLLSGASLRADDMEEKAAKHRLKISCSSLVVEYFRPDQREDNVRVNKLLQKAGLAS